MKYLAFLLLTFSFQNCNSVNKLPFDQALTEAQNWVGQHEIYAVGESLDKNGTKVILVFAQDTTIASKNIPKEIHGHKVIFQPSDEIIPQKLDKEE